MIKTVKKSQNSNWFMDLLLDETICAGTVAVPREMVRLAGGVNKRLGAKQKYELLLRIAAETPVELAETDEDACGQENMMVFDDVEKPENNGLGWRTDCYVLGKYSAQLQEAGYFNAAIEAVLAEAQMEGRYEETVSYLEGMIGHKEEYYRIDEAAQPILIYKETRYVITYSRSLRNSSERLLNAGESGFFISIRKNTIRVKLSSLREGILRR